MMRLGRKHRSYFRIVAIDGRQPRDGRTIEELGTYDPMIKDTDSRVTLIPDSDQEVHEEGGGKGRSGSDSRNLTRCVSTS
jgi:ribosomal protein S16